MKPRKLAISFGVFGFLRNHDSLTASNGGDQCGRSGTRRRVLAIFFRSRLDQIINLKHELVQLAEKIDWAWIDSEIAPLYSENGRPGVETRFVIGLLLLKHIYGLSDDGVCDRWICDPYFQYFTGEEFFQHVFPHERITLYISPVGSPYRHGRESPLIHQTG